MANFIIEILQVGVQLSQCWWLTWHCICIDDKMRYKCGETCCTLISNWFRPCQCCYCLRYPWEYFGLEILISYIWAQVLEACDCLKLLSIYCNLCVDATGVVCHQLGLLSNDLHAKEIGCGEAVEALSRCSTNFASSSSSPAKANVTSKAEAGDCSASSADSAIMIF